MAAIDRPPQALRQVNLPIGTERRHRLFGLRIQRNHLRERGEDDNAFLAAVAPVSHAAVQPAIVRGYPEAVLVDFGVKHPFGFA